MSKKYIVAEINESSNFNRILGVVTEHCQRFAVVNKVQGIFKDANDNRRCTRAGRNMHSNHSADDTSNLDNDASDDLLISDERDLRIRFSDSFDDNTSVVYADEGSRKRKRRSGTLYRSCTVTPTSPNRISCGVGVPEPQKTVNQDSPKKSRG